MDKKAIRISSDFWTEHCQIEACSKKLGADERIPPYVCKECKETARKFLKERFGNLPDELEQPSRIFYIIGAIIYHSPLFLWVIIGVVLFRLFLNGDWILAWLLVAAVAIVSLRIKLIKVYENDQQ